MGFNPAFKGVKFPSFRPLVLLVNAVLRRKNDYGALVE